MVIGLPAKQKPSGNPVREFDPHTFRQSNNIRELMSTIRGYETKEVQLSVSNRNILEAAVKIIEQHHKLCGSFLNKELTEVRADDHHYHGSVTDHKVRDASPEDVEGWKLIGALNKLARVEDLEKIKIKN